MPKTAKEMEKLLLADGWMVKNQRGSHRHYIHPQKPGKVTIPFHGNKTLKVKTEKQIYLQASLPKEEHEC